MAAPPEIPGVEHRYVDAGGLRVHVAEAGEGDPVLLLHGWPQHHYMWRGVIERLAPQYRLLAPDLRGFGWTDTPDTGYDGETFASDQVALLDALEIERVKVVGHDWGGCSGFGIRSESSAWWYSMCRIRGQSPALATSVSCPVPCTRPSTRLLALGLSSIATP